MNDSFIGKAAQLSDEQIYNLLILSKNIADIFQDKDMEILVPEELEKSRWERAQPLLVRVAKEEIKSREEQQKICQKYGVNEVGWDILLELYLAKTDFRRVSVTSVCYATRAPSTTSIRWLKILEEKGAVIRSKSLSDERVSFVEISRDAYEDISKWLDWRMQRVRAFACSVVQGEKA